MTTQLDGPATHVPALQSGRRRRRRQPARTRSGHRTAYLWEQVWAARELAGDPRPLPHRPARQEEAAHQRRSSRATTSSTSPASCMAAVLAGRAGRQVPGAALGRLGQDQLHRLDGALPGRPARRRRQEGLRHGARRLRPQRASTPSCRRRIFDFERTTGVVATINGEDGSKSAELAEALSARKKIVVCTIQTFPFALEEVRELAATAGQALRGDRRRGAQLADRRGGGEAQGGALARGAGRAERRRRGEHRGHPGRADGGRAPTTRGITFVAFTATPKNKTLELFGTRPDPTRKPAPDNIPAPFHVYSMRQAIEEKFILDVLQELHARTSWPSSWRTRARSSTTRRSSAARP